MFFFAIIITVFKLGHIIISISSWNVIFSSLRKWRQCGPWSTKIVLFLFKGEDISYQKPSLVTARMTFGQGYIKPQKRVMKLGDCFSCWMVRTWFLEKQFTRLQASAAFCLLSYYFRPNLLLLGSVFSGRKKCSSFFEE